VVRRSCTVQAITTNPGSGTTIFPVLIPGVSTCSIIHGLDGALVSITILGGLIWALVAIIIIHGVITVDGGDLLFIAHPTAGTLTAVDTTQDIMVTIMDAEVETI